MKDVKVCGPWHGKPKEEFRFVNDDPDQAATISKYADNEWPFVEGPDIVVPKKGPGGPGTKVCHLKDLPDHKYWYWVDICPTEGAPQNVTIP
jgi:hypothetical protein